MKKIEHIEDIKCPHCGENQGYNTTFSHEIIKELVTYWGRTSFATLCSKCGDGFFIQECVTRHWEVYK